MNQQSAKATRCATVRINRWTTVRSATGSLARRRSLALAALLAAGALTVPPALAQSFPSKPIRMVVTFPSGGAPDILARLFADKASLGQPIVVENTPGAGGNIGAANVSGELFKSLTGTSMQHVPYKGRQFAIPDLVGGQIQVMFDNMPSALPMAKEGKIRALAQTTAKRSPAAPDIPTVAETVPGFEATTWFAVFAPAGTPREVVTRINGEIQRVFALPDVLDKLKTLGLDAWISTPDELAKLQASEIVKWAKVVKDSGAKAD